MYRKISKGLESTGYRIRKIYRENGVIKKEIVTWIIRNCSDCGKFIGKSVNSGRCKLCSKNYAKEYNKKYNREVWNKTEKHRKYHREYMKRWYKKNKGVLNK